VEKPVTIGPFKGEHRWLSNFWPALVKLDGFLYPTVEHAYVAAKTTDPMIRKVIQTTDKPGEVKRLGRQFDLREDWHDIKLQVMEDLLWQKFQDPVLKEQLLATGDEEIVEINTWNDTFWGQCKGKGQNHLGKLLMKIREALRGQ
jgi:ribA/ribD-fused uncharacterized protein